MRLTQCAIRILAVATLAVATFATAQNGREYISHTVARGETISLICLKYYGRYSEKLAASIREANPTVADINKVKPGQTIRLRKPIAPKAAERATLPPEEISIFEQRVEANQGVVTMARGTVHLTRAGSAPLAIESNMLVLPGDILETGADGRAEIIINRESVVRMKEHSKITLDAMRDPVADKGKTKVGFSLGTVWTKMQSYKDKVCRFELELPTAIAGVHGTVYQTTVSADKSAEVKVYNGEVAVNGRAPSHAGPTSDETGEVAGPEEIPGPQEVSFEEWVRIVRSMQKIAIGSNGQPTQPAQFKRAGGDEWEKFNEERDKQVHVILGLAIALPGQ